MLEILVTVFVIIAPIMFITGLIFLIFFSQKRTLGLLLMLGALLIELIGFSICTSIFRHASPEPYDEKEISANKSVILKEEKMLVYFPTYDRNFKDSAQLGATDFMTGWIYLDSLGKFLHFSLAVGEWDSLRCETGSYTVNYGTIECTFISQWIIPYESIEKHSLEDLNFKNAVRKSCNWKNFILKKNNNKKFPYYSDTPFNDFAGLVFKQIDKESEIAKDLLYLDQKINN